MLPASICTFVVTAELTVPRSNCALYDPALVIVPALMVTVSPAASWNRIFAALLDWRT